jgi:hypothetical protein
LPTCAPAESAGEIVVCGRTRRFNDQRLPELDPRFAKTDSESGLFARKLSDRATLDGGGPKGSVGFTLRIGF